MLRIGWFSTGRGEGSQGLLRFVYPRLADIDARIDFVFSNRAPGEAEGSDAYFRLVRQYGLPLITHSSAGFRRRRGGGVAAHRAAYDAEVLERLAGYRPNICVLAGYMLVAGPALCRAWPLLNLHPALPGGPAGAWLEVVWQLIRQRAAVTGAMTHLATAEVDRGPVVSYVTVPLDTMRTSNEEILLIVMTEDRRGLDEIEEIAAVDGVDVISLGPTDISTALGMTDPNDPRLRQEFESLAARVNAVGKAKVYIPVNHAALRLSPQDLLAMGVNYTSVAPAPPTIVLSALRESAARIRAETAQAAA